MKTFILLQIHFLNVEIGVFLRYLQCFSKIENVQISAKTVQLMQEANFVMRQMCVDAEIVADTAKNDVDFIFQLDENQFELQRHIYCRNCRVSTKRRLFISTRKNA